MSANKHALPLLEPFDRHEQYPSRNQKHEVGCTWDSLKPWLLQSQTQQWFKSQIKRILKLGNQDTANRIFLSYSHLLVPSLKMLEIPCGARSSLKKTKVWSPWTLIEDPEISLPRVSLYLSIFPVSTCLGHHGFVQSSSFCSQRGYSPLYSPGCVARKSLLKIHRAIGTSCLLP